MTSAYENLPVPGQYTGPSFTDTEILYSSTAGSYTQKGVTIAGGQGILPAGCVLGRKTSDKKYYVYDNAASDGTEVAKGILRRGVDTNANSSRDQLGNILYAGKLKLSLLSGADSNAITDLNARTDTVIDLFSF